MSFVYVLKSLSVNKSYVGSTNNLSRRLKEHEKGQSGFTKKFLPWKLIYTEDYATLADARKREKYLKSAAGRKFLKKVFANH